MNPDRQPPPNEHLPAMRHTKPTPADFPLCMQYDASYANGDPTPFVVIAWLPSDLLDGGNDVGWWPYEWMSIKSPHYEKHIYAI